MAIISCPNCCKQVSDKALKCSQCGYLIANLEKQESISLEQLQEKIQDIVSASTLNLAKLDIDLTVEVNSVDRTLYIKLTRTGVKNFKPTYNKLWIEIKLQLKPDNLKGFSKVLISSKFEGEIKSEWERKYDIDEKGKLIQNLQSILSWYFSRYDNWLDFIFGAFGELFSVIVVINIVIYGIFSLLNHSHNVSPSLVTDSRIYSSRHFTISQYMDIRDGMTYEQVKEITATDGKKVNRSHIINEEEGIDILMVSYSWENPDGSYMVITFLDNNIVIRKEQSGLK
jgi:hypothetical protein